VLFHYASRQGLTDQALGAKYPFMGEIAPTPAVKPPGGAERITLPMPDLQRAFEHDPPFGKVMESRQSRRQYGKVPIHAEQLGEFLYRVARIRGLRPVSPELGLHYEVTNRTYPSGGAAYDLELYITVRSCQGITN
jgi:hypothetical protein